MTSPNSNLTSDDLMGIINGNLPELLHLPNDFLPTTKKLIDHKHGDKIWRYAVHFDRSLPEKILLILKWNLSWRRSTFFMKKPTII